MSVFLKLTLLFLFGSTCGWILEFFFRRIVHKKWINPGFLTGPCLPLYGTGVVGLYLICSIDCSFISSPIWQHVFLVFLITVAMTAVEYITGLIFIRGLHVQLWDYSERFANIQGIICPLFTLAWGAIGALYYFFLHEHMVYLADWIVSAPAYSFFIGIFYGILFVDIGYSFHVVTKIRSWAKEKGVVVKYETLKESVREKANEIKDKVHYVFAFRSKDGLDSELDYYHEQEKNRRPKDKI